MEILNKAISYIESGLSIHLLKPGLKAPIHNAWSSVENLTVKNLYEEFKQNPDANIGIRLGNFSKIDDYFVYVFDLDISSNSPDDIIEAYNKLSEIYKDYSNLPTMRSASKNSRHFYFLSRKVLKNKKLAKSSRQVLVTENGVDRNRSAWEIDLFATGKQVVIAPSVFNGNTYKWEDGKDILDFLKDNSKKLSIVIDDLKLSEEEKKDMQPAENVVLNLFEIKEILDELDEDWLEDYDKWLKLGMSLHHQFADTENEQEALGLYEQFSKKSEKYQKGACFNKWKSFTKKEDGITIGTLLFNRKKKTSLNKIEEFSKFLAENKVDLDNLKDKIKQLNMTEIELEFFIQDIADSLSLTMNRKFMASQARKVLNSFKKEIKKEFFDEEEKLDTGLDYSLTDMILNNEFNSGKYLVNINKNLFQYKKGVWKVIDNDVLASIVTNAIRNILLSEDPKNNLLKKAIIKKKKNDDLNGLTNQIVSLMLKLTAKSEDEDILNLKGTRIENFSVINTLNKEIYIEQDGSITALDHKYDSYLINQFEVSYDPDAKCPVFEKTLDDVFAKLHDKNEVKRHFLECMGQIIQSKKNIEMFLIMIGAGENGKSLLAKSVLRMMGLNNVLATSITKFNQSSHSEASLLGKLVLIDDDWKKNDILDDGFLKKTSSSNMLTGNPKYKGPITFMSNTTSIIIANNNPKTRDVSHGLGRRAQIFPFTRIFNDSDRDVNLISKLDMERSGILNLLLKNYINLLKRGYLIVPQSCQDAQRAWINSSNPVQAFVHDRYVITGDITDKIKAQDVYDTYKKYIRIENESMQMTRNNFYDDLRSFKDLQIITNSSDKAKYFHGIKAKM